MLIILINNKMRMIEDLVDNCDLSDYISYWFHLNPVPITYGMSTESIESGYKFSRVAFIRIILNYLREY